MNSASEENEFSCNNLCLPSVTLGSMNVPCDRRFPRNLVASQSHVHLWPLQVQPVKASAMHGVNPGDEIHGYLLLSQERLRTSALDIAKHLHIVPHLLWCPALVACSITFVVKKYLNGDHVDSSICTPSADGKVFLFLKSYVPISVSSKNDLAKLHPGQFEISCSVSSLGVLICLICNLILPREERVIRGSKEYIYLLNIFKINPEIFLLPICKVHTKIQPDCLVTAAKDSSKCN